MVDDHFTRSVIYLCEHNEEGSFGFILNSTLEVKLHEFTSTFPDNNAVVGFGGPVDRDQLFFIHTISSLSSNIPIANGIFMGGDYEEMLEQMARNEVSISDVRFFIGYTGWGPHQLQEELNAKAWIVAAPPPSFSLMRTRDETLWKSILSELGGKYRLMAEYPLNPSDN
jgi:putative transcriptional regulator